MNRITDDLALEILSLMIGVLMIAWGIVPLNTPANKIITIIGGITLICVMARWIALAHKLRKQIKSDFAEQKKYVPTRRSNIFFAIDTILLITWFIIMLLFTGESPKPTWLVFVTLGTCAVLIAGAVFYFLQVRKRRIETGRANDKPLA